ncbi:hypothetical protein SAMN05216339_102217 [Nitrosomonas eutropha]|uniref:Uncharacterized protein n=1 Tax=Nitrosomonas eutropha TaxID=916 RepID=A0A1I7G530_9PROT|nr:hypothetical protein [Nitrosomonas eutropha]SFU43533.1 hypothetical protein SAMN05216339_102217 [Nitrosomonas eutropha]
MRIKSFRLMVKNIQSCLAMLILSCSMVAAYAEDLNTRTLTQDHFHQEWERATDEELSTLRGGFILPNGIHIDMNLEKFIHLNDMLVHSSSMQVPGESVVLQTGMQNLAPDSVAMPQLSSFIQNTLDSQHIDALTKINIEVSNLKEVMANGSNHRVFTEFLAPALLR